MAEVKISGLAIATDVIGSDIVAGVNDSGTKSISIDKILRTTMLTESVWREARSAANDMKVSPTIAPSFEKLTDDGSGSTGVYTYVFSADRDEEIYFAIHLGSNYKLGTDFYPTFHFIPGDTGTGNVKIDVEYFLVNGSFGSSTIITKTLALDGTQEHKDVDFDAIDGTPYTGIDNIFLIRLRRDVSVADNYAGNVFILEFTVKHEIDQLGNSTRTTK